MPIGTLKYKQDDGSIVELLPVGYVKTETYTAGQAMQNTSIAAAQAAADKANTNIGDWETDHPGQTVNQCATSLENEVAAVDAKADANTANIGACVKTEYLDRKPYQFAPTTLTRVEVTSAAQNMVIIPLRMTWLHTTDYNNRDLNPKFLYTATFNIVNLKTGDVTTVSSDNVTINATADFTIRPYDIDFTFAVPVELEANSVYLIAVPYLGLSIE